MKKIKDCDCSFCYDRKAEEKMNNLIKRAETNLSAIAQREKQDER